MLRKTALTALMAALAAGTAGCTYLPGAGPSARAIEAGAEVSTADGGLLARYEIVDVTPAVIEGLRGRPLDSLLASFGDHRPSSEPVIGVGDMVAVSIWEAGSGGLFSGPLVADRFSAGSKSALIPEQPVARDGTITVPYAGRIQVAGRRPQDVQALIEDALAGKAIQPQALVSVTRPISQAVTVAGEGAAGARLPLSGHGDRVLDVIAAAGGNRAPVSETFVRLSRGPVTATVPLTAVVSNPRENIYLRPNDVLTLVRDPQTFLAVGALGNATELPFQADGITLAQALAKARGLQDFAADPAGTFVFRFEPASVVRRIDPASPFLAANAPGRGAGNSGAGNSGAGNAGPGGPGLVPVVYRLDLRDPNSLFVAQGFRMRNRDLVYVSNAPFTELTKALTAFSGITGPAASVATSYAYIK